MLLAPHSKATLTWAAWALFYKYFHYPNNSDPTSLCSSVPGMQPPPLQFFTQYPGQVFPVVTFIHCFLPPAAASSSTAAHAQAPNPGSHIPLVRQLGQGLKCSGTQALWHMATMTEQSNTVAGGVSKSTSMQTTSISAH